MNQIKEWIGWRNEWDKMNQSEGVSFICHVLNLVTTVFQLLWWRGWGKKNLQNLQRVFGKRGRNEAVSLFLFYCKRHFLWYGTRRFLRTKQFLMRQREFEQVTFLRIFWPSLLSSVNDRSLKREKVSQFCFPVLPVLEPSCPILGQSVTCSWLINQVTFPLVKRRQIFTWYFSFLSSLVFLSLYLPLSLSLYLSSPLYFLQLCLWFVRQFSTCSQNYFPLTLFLRSKFCPFNISFSSLFLFSLFLSSSFLFSSLLLFPWQYHIFFSCRHFFFQLFMTTVVARLSFKILGYKYSIDNSLGTFYFQSSNTLSLHSDYFSILEDSFLHSDYF